MKTLTKFLTVVFCFLIGGYGTFVLAAEPLAVVPTGPEPYVSELISCLKEDEARSLGMLVLMDMSSSLTQIDDKPGTDLGNKRILASETAIKRIFELRSQFNVEDSKRTLEIDVRFDGFGERYLEGEWVRLDSTAGVVEAISEVNDFRTRNQDRLTDYSTALNRAASAADDYRQIGCPLIFWFTDGRFDTDNNRLTSSYSPTEVAEIEGNSLCGPGGPVDNLRRSKTPIVAIALGKSDWSLGRRENEFSLLRSIVEGVEISGPVLDGFECGSETALGKVVEASDAEELVYRMTTAISDALFEVQKGGGGDDDDDDPPVVEDGSCDDEGLPSGSCVITVYLANYVESFALYAKVPNAPDVNFVLKDPLGNRSALGTTASSDTSGLGVLSSQVGSYAWVRGTNPYPQGDWSGPWELLISGYGDSDPEVVAHIFPGKITATANPLSTFSLERNEFDSEEISIELRSESVPITSFTEGSGGPRSALERVGGRIQVGSSTLTAQFFGEGSRVAPGSGTSGSIASDAGAGENKNLPAISRSDLAELWRKIDPEDGWEWGLLVSGIQSTFRVFDGIFHTATSDDVFIWFDDQASVSIAESDKVINIAEREKGSAFRFRLQRNGVFVPRSEDYEVTLDVRLGTGPSSMQELGDLVQGADGSFSIPGDVMDRLIDDVENFEINLEVTPTVVHNSTGARRPSSVAIYGNVILRRDNGLPVVLQEHSIESVSADDQDKPAVLRIRVVPPLEGRGNLTILGISKQPTYSSSESEYLNKSFTLGESRGCESVGQDSLEGEESFVTCEVDLVHDWRGSIESVSGMQLTYELSGTESQGGQTVVGTFDVDDFSMSRKMKKGDFWKTVAICLLIFLLIQFLMRMIYTFTISKWMGAPIGVRNLEIEVTITPESHVRSKSGVTYFAEPKSTDLTFANEFENDGRKAAVDEQQFAINFWRTFFGERVTDGLGKLGAVLRKQEPLVRVSAPGFFVVGDAGFTELNPNGSEGLMRVTIMSGWTLRVASQNYERLVMDGESVDGILWTLAMPNLVRPRLDELRDALDGAGNIHLQALRDGVQHLYQKSEERRLDTDGQQVDGSEYDNTDKPPDLPFADTNVVRPAEVIDQTGDESKLNKRAWWKRKRSTDNDNDDGGSSPSTDNLPFA